jgi:hypothetical protein
MGMIKIVTPVLMLASLLLMPSARLLQAQTHSQVEQCKMVVKQSYNPRSNLGQKSIHQRRLAACEYIQSNPPLFSYLMGQISQDAHTLENNALQGPSTTICGPFGNGISCNSYR